MGKNIALEGILNQIRDVRQPLFGLVIGMILMTPAIVVVNLLEVWQ